MYNGELYLNKTVTKNIDTTQWGLYKYSVSGMPVSSPSSHPEYAHSNDGLRVLAQCPAHTRCFLKYRWPRQSMESRYWNFPYWRLWRTEGNTKRLAATSCHKHSGRILIWLIGSAVSPLPLFFGGNFNLQVLHFPLWWVTRQRMENVSHYFPHLCR